MNYLPNQEILINIGVKMRVLVFGASGALGSAICREFKEVGHEVVTASRTVGAGDLTVSETGDFELSDITNFDACVWAQGSNSNDTVASAKDFNLMMQANVGFIVNSLSKLINRKLLSNKCRIVIVSSVWQEFSRENKFSYTVSKAALEGLVNSVVADYSKEGISINAVLPGVVDTPMTRKNLDAEQVANITNQTPTRNLVSPTNVAKAVSWLASEHSEGVNGQFITIDNGWSKIRAI